MRLTAFVSWAAFGLRLDFAAVLSLSGSDVLADGLVAVNDAVDAHVVTP